MIDEPATQDRPAPGNTRRRATLAGRALGVVRPVLIDKVERDHQQSDAQFLRRRIVVAVTIVVGATLLGLSFSTEPGDPSFYPLTFALAATWVVGSLVSGPLHLGHIVRRSRTRRPIVTPIVVGLLLAGVFVVGGLVTREIPVLAQFTNNVLGYAKAGSLWLVALVTLVNGVAEELFFRGRALRRDRPQEPGDHLDRPLRPRHRRRRQPGPRLRRRDPRPRHGPAASCGRRGPRPGPDPHHLVDGDAPRPAAHLPLSPAPSRTPSAPAGAGRLRILTFT